MDMVAILIMCPKCGEQTFVPPASGFWEDVWRVWLTDGRQMDRSPV